MSRIKKLSIYDFKRIEVAEITPDGNLVTITGRNGQGKSSVLDAIAAVLGGVNKKTTPVPIRVGADKAEIIAETDDGLVITRRFTASGPSLSVATVEGAKFPKGQAKLDSLLGRLTFDPLEFTRMDDKKQLETLLELVDLPFDPEKHAMQREGIFNRRTEVGRQAKAIGDVEVDKSLAPEEVSAGDLIRQINEIKDIEVKRSEITSHIDRVLDRRKDIQSQIDALQREIGTTFDQERAAQQELQALPVTPDTTPMYSQLEKIEESNAAIRANNVAREQLQHKADLLAEYDSLTNDLQAHDQAKADALANADMPVDGLGFDDHGVTFEGIPFKQLNTGADVIISASIGMALNPDLRVMRIAEGSLLDTESLAELEKLADKHDYQIWLEVVSDGEGPGIVIEDGTVKE